VRIIKEHNGNLMDIYVIGVMKGYLEDEDIDE